jgi:hypothetical protein
VFDKKAEKIIEYLKMFLIFLFNIKALMLNFKINNWKINLKFIFQMLSENSTSFLSVPERIVKLMHP